VLLCVQSDTHRRLWNRQGQWAKLSADRGVQAFWSWKKYLQYEIKHQNQYRHYGVMADTNYRGTAATLGAHIPSILRMFGSLAPGSIFFELRFNQVTL